MTTVSVLLAIRDGERTAAAAIHSIRQQTWRDWELVIVDDGSRDGTPALLAALDDPRVRVLRNEVGRGLAASLNRAFAVSRGELLARMDADDTALPHRLERQVAFLAARPEVDIVGSAALLVDAQGREVGIGRRRERHEEIARAILKENPFIHPAVMMRRRVLVELGGYDESLQRAQDYDLWLRGLGRFRYHNLQEPLLRYRLPAGPSWRTSWAAARVLLRHAGARGAVFALRLLAARVLAPLVRRRRLAPR